jgi:hypothetical protein
MRKPVIDDLMSFIAAQRARLVRTSSFIPYEFHRGIVPHKSLRVHPAERVERINMKILDGWKTYIIGLTGIAVGVGCWKLGLLNGETAILLVFGGLTAMGLRDGLTKK